MHVYTIGLISIVTVFRRASALPFLLIFGLQACEFRPANGVKLLAIQDAITPPASLQSTTQSDSAGALMAIAGDPIPTITVRAIRTDGSEQTSSEHKVTAHIESDAGDVEMTGTTTQKFKNGVASFDDLIITRAGSGYRIVFESTGGAETDPVLIHVAPSTPDSIHFDGELTGLESGTLVAGAPLGARVVLRDRFENQIQASSVEVTLSLNTGTLFGHTALSTTNGQGAVSSLEVHTAGSNYQLIASSPGLTSATSEAFAVTSAPATTIQVSNDVTPSVAAGSSVGNITLVAKDTYGNIATGHTQAITASLQTNPTGATLSGTTTLTPSGGTYAWNDLSIDKAGTGYVLGFSDGTITATSSTIMVSPGSATSLVVTSQPASTQAGNSIGTLQVTAKDAFGNIATGYAGSLTASLSSNPGNATLTGTLTVSPVAGVFTIPNLSLNKVGTGYTLLFTSGSLNVASAAFNITHNSATGLAIIDPPGSAVAGSSLGTIRVAAVDNYGNTATGYTDPLIASIRTNPGSASLFGTTSVSPASGIYTLSDLNIRVAASGYQLGFDSGSLTPVTSSLFAIGPSAASSIELTSGPSGTPAGSSIGPLGLRVRDSYGNTVTGYSSNLTVSLSANPTSTALLGTTSVSPVNGVFTLSDLVITAAASGYMLQFSTGSLSSVTSSSFTISPLATHSLALDAAPGSTTAGASLGSIQVSARDIYNNLATSESENLSITLSTNPTSATLHGTTSLAPTAGIYSVSDLNIRNAGSGYVLQFSKGSQTVASSPITISHAEAAAIQIVSQPAASTVAGSSLGSIQVTVLDTYGNTATAHATVVTVAFDNNAGSGTLGGTLSAAPSGGSATFGDLWVNKSGSGYTLAFSSGGLSATSANFAITPAAISSASVVSLSSTSVNPFEYVTATLVAKDAYGNIRSSGGDTVTFTSASSTGGSTAVVGVTADVGGGSYQTSVLARAAGNSAALIGALVGASPVAVTNTANLTVLGSDGTFEYDLGSLGVNDSASTGQQGYAFNSAEAADLNEDGYTDVVFVGNTQQRIYWGGPAGRIGRYKTIGTTNAAKHVAFGDLNQDGHLDMVIGYELVIRPTVYLGDGMGGFTMGQTLPACDGNAVMQTQNLALVDLNEDGKLDLVTANEARPTCYYKGLGAAGDASTQFTSFTGNGSLPAHYVLLSAVELYMKVRAADLNNDGHQDLVITDGKTANQKHVLLGNGTGTLSEVTTPIAGPFAEKTQGLAIGDLNHDGILDLLLGNRDTTTKFSFGNGNGTFQSATAVTGSAASLIYDENLVDLDGDGYLDMIEANRSGADVVRKWSPATGNFTAFPTVTTLGTNSYRALPVDLNRDGRMDIVFAQTGTNQPSYIAYGSRVGTIKSVLAKTPSGAANAGAKYPATPSVQTNVLGAGGVTLTNLSGITYVPATGTYFVIRNNDNRMHEFTTGFVHLREITLNWDTSTTPKEGDLEDLVYLGQQGSDPEFALVNEKSEVFIGTVPAGATSIYKANFRKITFDNSASGGNADGSAGIAGGASCPNGAENCGIEGIAYDSVNQVFYAVREGKYSGTAGSNYVRYIYRFPRPAGTSDVNIASLKTTERWPITTPQDLSGVTFDPRTGHLLLLSHESVAVFEAPPWGTIWGKQPLTGTNGTNSQWEGITLGPNGELVVVSEPTGGNSRAEVYNYTP